MPTATMATVAGGSGGRRKLPILLINSRGKDGNTPTRSLIALHIKRKRIEGGIITGMKNEGQTTTLGGRRRQETKDTRAAGGSSPRQWAMDARNDAGEVLAVTEGRNGLLEVAAF